MSLRNKIDSILEDAAITLLSMTKGGAIMMAMFFAQRVILGKTAYKDVPAKLKSQVKELLEDSGLGDLAVE